MKITFIATVYNEEKTIEKLLESLLNQTGVPDEIVIVDGGSSDRTVASIKYQIANSKYNKGNFRLIIKEGNRSVGRNEAIKNSTWDIIACSDAGCVLDKDWLRNITEPLKDPKVDAVAGYYKGLAKNVFQKCLVPYVLVMGDKVDPANFLPAARSMAFKKSAWKEIGGFDQRYSKNEDYVFARRLRKMRKNIYFAKDAVVYWIPRDSLGDAFLMFYRFSLGDAEARILRPKVVLIFLRYIVGIMLACYFLVLGSQALGIFILSLFILYLVWTIVKNYNYVKSFKAIFILPVLQITSDVAVISGTIAGIARR